MVTGAHLVRLVPKKVDLVEPLVRDVPQAEGLVPPGREDVERDLAADRVREAVVGERGL